MAGRCAERISASEERGNAGAILIAIILFVAIFMGGYFLLNGGRNDSAQAGAVTLAADGVGGATQDATQ